MTKSLLPISSSTTSILRGVTEIFSELIPGTLTVTGTMTGVEEMSMICRISAIAVISAARRRSTVRRRPRTVTLTSSLLSASRHVMPMLST